MSSTQTIRLLTRELSSLTQTPPEGVRVTFKEDDLSGGVVGIVEGPAGTPYASGYFRIKFDFLDVDFPSQPPKCTMLTKIFHPNISKSGEICVDTLKKGWRREMGIGHVLVTIKCLLIVPNPESALDEEAGKLLLEEYDSYFKMAKLMTSIHATPKRPPPEFANALASTSHLPTSTSASSTAHLTSAPMPTSTSTKSRSTNSPSPAPSASATFSPRQQPLPLQTHLQQQQGSASGSTGVVAGEGKGLGLGLGAVGMGAGAVTGGKTGAVGGGKEKKTTASAGGEKAAAGGKAKRGLKRL